MIDKAEIDHVADELGVHAAHVQRDYVFGWLLAGLFEGMNPLAEQLVLKGGNAFRKAYFPNARYSNDLDFSTETELDGDILREALIQACDFAGAGSGVAFVPENTRVGEVGAATQESGHYEGRVYFKSFYGEDSAILKIDLDVKELDRIFLPIQTRRLIHAYSDADLCRADIRCMKLEELLAAKLKALLQRQHSPDLYDFVYATFVDTSLDISRKEVITTFLKKTIYEPDPQVARGLFLSLPFQTIRALWDKYLVCPRMALIAFENAERAFRDVIMELFGALTPSPRPMPAFAAAPIGYYTASQRAVIMEAGRLQKLLRVTYKGFTRLVEPYSLVSKRRADGAAREYFYVWDLSGGRSGQQGIKSFFADELQDVQITDTSFTPRYPIELTKASGYFARPFSPSGGTRPPVRRQRPRAATTFTVECPYCGKSFKRTTPDVHLNEHKDRYGNRCYGRMGVLV